LNEKYETILKHDVKIAMERKREVEKQEDEAKRERLQKKLDDLDRKKVISDQKKFN